MKIKNLISTSVYTSILSLVAFSGSLNAAVVDVSESKNLADVWTEKTTSGTVALTENWTFNLSNGAVLTTDSIKKLTGNYSVTVTGDGSIAFTNEFNFSNSGTNYICVSSTGARFSVNNGSCIMNIGKDSAGNFYDISGKGIMANNGTVNVYGNTTITGTANFCSTTKESYIATNASLGTKSASVAGARFAYAKIDGSVYNTSSQTANGWCYSLAFGWIGETGNQTKATGITLGTKASIVNASTSSSSNKGAYFSVYGNLVSNVDTAQGGIVQSIPEMHIYDTSKITFNTTDAFQLGYSDSKNKVFNTQATSTFYIGENVTKTIQVKKTVTNTDGSTKTETVSESVEGKHNANVEFDINADNNFGKIVFCYATEANKSSLSLSTGGFNVTIGNIEFFNEFCSVVLTDNNWVNDKLLIVENDVAYWQEKIDNGQISYVGTAEGALTAVAGNGGTYLNLVAVPEPAHWAAIFGAIAFGFVVYRRRK